MIGDSRANELNSSNIDVTEELEINLEDELDTFMVTTLLNIEKCFRYKKKFDNVSLKNFEKLNANVFSIIARKLNLKDPSAEVWLSNIFNYASQSIENDINRVFESIKLLIENFVIR